MNKRSIVAAAAVAAVLMLAAPAAASADVNATPTPTPTASAGELDYTPVGQQEPSLAGSSANAVCLQSAPWINYQVTLTDPEGLAGNQAQLVMSDGTHQISLQLGSLAAGSIAGSVLWPGASVDGQGVGDGWPGWEYEQGTWLETSDNFAWTRGDIEAWIRVNPDLDVPLSYPDESAECAGPAGEVSSTGTQGRLPATGGSSAAVMPLAGVAVGAVVAGLVVLLVRRRHRA